MQEYCRIRVILVEHYCRTLDRLQCVAVLHCACNHHGVYPVACREYKGVAGEHIALVVVCNCICHVEGIGLVAVQVVLEIDNYAFVLKLEFGCLLQRRGEEQALWVLYSHIFVECKYQLSLVCGHICLSCKRIEFGDEWRYRVLWTTARRGSSVGARW